MSRIAWWLAGTLALAGLGCAGGTSPSAVLAPEEAPAGAPLAASSDLGSVYQYGALSQSALALYTIDVDPAALAATVSLRAARSGQANDDLYALAIDNFMRASSLKIDALSSTAGTIDLTYSVSHPFPGPSDPAGTPNGSTNRADLCITGFVCFLVDVPAAAGNTYFSDRVVNTAAIANADAYFAPAGMISYGGTANTFPYKLLVDENLPDGSRVGVSNGGSFTGNFGADGWTRAELGSGNNGWTGYGILAQGQTSRNTVSLDLAELQANGFSLDIAVIAQYNDPRGGANADAKRANRLPPATPDASLFAYRMPHGALDVASVEFLVESGGFIQNQLSASTLNFRVVDWDARATETTAGDLSDDPDVTTVAVGESGLPGLAVCIPGVLGDATAVELWDAGTDVQDDDTVFGGDPGQDSGAQGDALYYTRSITKTVTSGQNPGTFTGMVRASDITAASPLWIPLNEGTPPLPLSSNLPVPETYQVFTVTQAPDNLPPAATVVLSTANPMNSGTSAGISITSISDPDADLLDISVNWGDGGGFVNWVSGLASPYANQSPVGPQMNNADLTPDSINVTVRLNDGTVDVDYPLSYQLGANRAPVVSGTPALQSANVSPPATFTMNQGTASATDPEGDTVSYTITNNVNSDQPTFAAFPNSANTTPISTLGSVTFTVYANDALHGTTSGTAYPGVNGTVVAPLGWAVKPPGSTSIEYSYDCAASGTGALLLGTYYGSQDFGGGNRTSNGLADLFVVKYDVNGNYLWDYTAGGSASEVQQGIDTDSAGNVYIAAYVSGTANFGGGIRTSASTDSFLIKLNSSGVYQWDYQFGGTLTDYVQTLDVSPSGDILAGGYYSSDPLTIGSFSANSNGNAGFLAKWNSSGTPVWANFYDGTSTASDYLYGASFDSSGNAYAVVQNWNTTLVGANYGGGPRLAVTSPDTYTLALNGAGAYLWDTNLAVGGSEYSYSVATSGTQVFSGGYWSGATDFGGGLRTSTGSGDVYVKAQSLTTGAYNWDWVSGAAGGTDIIRGLETDSSGNLFVVGYAYTNSNFGGGARTAVGLLDMFIVKLNSAGAWQWDHMFGSTSSDYAYGCAVDSNNDVLVSGYFYNTVDFEPGAGVTNLTSAGSADPFLMKVDGPTGTW